MTRRCNIFPKTGNFFPKYGNGRRTFAEQREAKSRAFSIQEARKTSLVRARLNSDALTRAVREVA